MKSLSLHHCRLFVVVAVAPCRPLLFVTRKAKMARRMNRSAVCLLLAVPQQRGFDKPNRPLDGRVYSQIAGIEQGSVIGAA